MCHEQNIGQFPILGDGHHDCWGVQCLNPRTYTCSHLQMMWKLRLPRLMTHPQDEVSRWPLPDEAALPPGLQKIVTCVVCMRFSCLTPLHPYIPTCSTFWPMKPGCWPSKSYLEMTWVPAESHLPCTTSGFRAAKLVQRWKSVFRSVSWRPPEHLPLPHGWRLFLITNLGMKWLKINHGKPHLIPLNHIESWPFNRMKPH